MGVVQRHRRDADHVGFAQVAQHPARGKEVEQAASALATADDADRQLATALRGVARGDHLQHVAQVGIDQLFEVTGE